MNEQIPAGTRVRFTTGPLGLTRGRQGTRFVTRSVGVGDEGVYDSPDESSDPLSDWHLIKVGTLWCPAHRSMFEVIGPTT